MVTVNSFSPAFFCVYRKYDKVDDEGTAQSGEEAVPEEEAPAEAAVLSESAEV